MGADAQLLLLSPNDYDYLARTANCAATDERLLSTAFQGRFLEVAVPISALKTITPNLTGFDITVLTTAVPTVARYVLH